MFSRQSFSLEYYYNRADFFFFFNGLNRKFYKTNGYLTGITYYRPFNRFCISLNLNLKHEVFSFLSKYRSLLDPNKGFFFDLKKFSFYIYFLSLDDLFSRSVAPRFKYASRSYFFRFFYFFRLYFFSRVIISLFFFDRFKLFFVLSKSYLHSSLVNFSSSYKLSINKHYMNFVYLFSNLFNFFDLPFLKVFFFYGILLNIFVKLNNAVVNSLRILLLVSNFIVALFTYGKNFIVMPVLLRHILIFLTFLLFYNFEIYKFVFKNFFIFFKPVLVNFLYIFDSFFFFNFDQLLFRNYFIFYDKKLNNLSFFVGSLFKYNSSFLSDIYRIKRKPVLKRYDWPYNIFMVTREAEFDLGKYKRRIFFRKKSYFSLYKYAKFGGSSFPVVGGLVRIPFNFYKRINSLTATGFAVRNNVTQQVLSRKNSLRFFFFKNFLFNSVNFVSWNITIFNSVFFSNFNTNYINEFKFDYITFFFLVKFYKDLFFDSDNIFVFENVRLRLTLLKNKAISYRSQISNFDNFLALDYSVKNNYRSFNIFSLSRSGFASPEEFGNFNTEVKAFSLLDNRFKLSLFIKSNFKFFYKFFKIILFSRLSFFVGEFFSFTLSTKAVKHLLSKCIHARAIYYLDKFIYINLIILDKLLTDYLAAHFSKFSNQFLTGYATLIFSSSYGNLYKNLTFSKSLLNFTSSFILRFNTNIFSLVNKTTDEAYRVLFSKAFEIYKVYRAYNRVSSQVSGRAALFADGDVRYKKVGKKKVFYKIEKTNLISSAKYEGLDLRRPMYPRFHSWLFWKKIANTGFILNQIIAARILHLYFHPITSIPYVENLFFAGFKYLKRFILQNPYNDGAVYNILPGKNFSFYSYRRTDTLLSAPFNKPVVIRKLSVIPDVKKKKRIFSSRFLTARSFWDFATINKFNYYWIFKTRFNSFSYGRVVFNRDSLINFNLIRFSFMDKIQEKFIRFVFNRRDNRSDINLQTNPLANTPVNLPTLRRSLEIPLFLLTQVKLQWLGSMELTRKKQNSTKFVSKFNRNFISRLSNVYTRKIKKNNVKNARVSYVRGISAQRSSSLMSDLSQSIHTQVEFMVNPGLKSLRESLVRGKNSARKQQINSYGQTNKPRRFEKNFRFIPKSVWNDEGWFINFSRKRTKFEDYYLYAEKARGLSFPAKMTFFFPFFNKSHIKNPQFEYNYFYSMTSHWRNYNARLLNLFGQFDHYYLGSDNFLMQKFINIYSGDFAKIAIQAKYYKLVEARPDFGWSQYAPLFKLFSMNRGATLKVRGLRYFYSNMEDVSDKNKRRFAKLLRYYNYFPNFYKDFYFRLFVDYDTYCFHSFPISNLFFFKSRIFDIYFNSQDKASFTIGAFSSVLTFINRTLLSNKSSILHARYRSLAARFFQPQLRLKSKRAIMFNFFLKRISFRRVNFSWSLKFFFLNKNFILGLKKFYLTKYRSSFNFMSDVYSINNSNFFNNLNMFSNRFSLFHNDSFSTYYYLAKLKHRESKMKLSWVNFQSGTGAYSLDAISSDFYLISSKFNNISSLFKIKRPLFSSRFVSMVRTNSLLFNKKFRFVRVSKAFRFDRQFAEGRLNSLVDSSYFEYIKLLGNYDLANFYFVADYFFLWSVIFYRKFSTFIFNKMYFFFVLIFLSHVNTTLKFNTLNNFASTCFFDFNDFNFEQLSDNNKFLINGVDNFTINSPVETSFLIPPLKFRVERLRYLPKVKSFFVFSFSNSFFYNVNLSK